MAGVSYSLTSGDIGISGHQGSISSALAARLAPPVCREVAGSLLLWVALSLVAGMLFIFINYMVSFYIVAAGIGLGFASAFSAERYNSKVVPGLMLEWDNEWLCNRCGSVFL
jgi:hypothetical protein